MIPENILTENPASHLLQEDKISTIVSHLNYFWDKTENIPTASLNKSGRGLVVQDAMSKYLDKGDKFYSSSNLKEAFVTPFSLYFSRDSGILEDEEQSFKEKMAKFETDPAYFDLGTYLHMCILEPTKFDRVVVEPSFPQNSSDTVTEGIKWWKEQLKKENEEDPTKFEEILSSLDEAMDNEGISPDKFPGLKFQYRFLKGCSTYQSVNEEHHQIITIAKKRFDQYGGGILRRLLKHSKREVSIYCDDYQGLPVKVRFDAMQFKENIGVDACISVKTTSQKSIEGFFYHGAKLKYGMSEAMYQDVGSYVTGRPFNTTITIMVQTVAPFDVAAFVWTDEDVQVNREKWMAAHSIAVECRETGKYPGFEAFAEAGNMGLIQYQEPNWNLYSPLPSTAEL